MQNQYPVYSIDLGSFNSSISCYYNGVLRPVVIENRETIPSSITYLDANNYVCGMQSLMVKHQHLRSTIDCNKRIKGRPFTDLQNEHISLPFDIAYSGDEDVVYYRFICENGEIVEKTAIQVDIDFIKWLLEQAVNVTGVPCEYLIVTCPAYFSDSQKEATLIAAQNIRPDIVVLPLLQEPIAAAIATNAMPALERRYVLVYDFGGGTFDVALMEEMLGTYTVVGTLGDACLGGIDITNHITNCILGYIYQHFGDIPQIHDLRCTTKLRDLCEEAKINLTHDNTFDINLECMGVHEVYTLTVNNFNYMISQFIDRTIFCCQELLRRTNVQLRDHDRILLVGGSSHINMIKPRLQEVFGVEVHNNVNAYNIVSLGAARKAVVQYCQDYNLTCPFHAYDIHLMAVREYGIGFNSNGDNVQTVIPIGTRAQERMEFQAHGFRFRCYVFTRNRPADPWKKVASFRLVPLPRITILLYLDRDGCICYEYNALGNVHRDKLQISIPIGRMDVITLQNRHQLVKAFIHELKKNIPIIEHHSDPQRRQLFLDTVNTAIQFFNSPDAIHHGDDVLQNYYNDVAAFIGNNWNN